MSNLPGSWLSKFIEIDVYSSYCIPCRRFKDICDVPFVFAVVRGFIDKVGHAEDTWWFTRMRGAGLYENGRTLRISVVLYP